MESIVCEPESVMGRVEVVDHRLSLSLQCISPYKCFSRATLGFLAPELVCAFGLAIVILRIMRRSSLFFCNFFVVIVWHLKIALALFIFHFLDDVLLSVV